MLQHVKDMTYRSPYIARNTFQKVKLPDASQRCRCKPHCALFSERDAQLSNRAQAKLPKINITAAGAVDREFWTYLWAWGSLRGGLGLSLSVLWGRFGALWDVLGHPWDPFEPLGPHWAALESFLGFR